MLVHTKKQITITVVANIYEKANSSLLQQPPVLLFCLKYSYTCRLSASHTPPIYIHQAQTCIRRLSAVSCHCFADEYKRNSEKPSDLSLVTHLTEELSIKGTLLSHKKEWNHATGSNMNGPRNDHTYWSKYGEGNGNPLQCSCLENPRDRGAWWAAISGVAQSRTRLKQLSSSSSSSEVSQAEKEKYLEISLICGI